jgi:hypothetical protein
MLHIGRLGNICPHESRFASVLPNVPGNSLPSLGAPRCQNNSRTSLGKGPSGSGAYP